MNVPVSCIDNIIGDDLCLEVDALTAHFLIRKMFARRNRVEDQ